MVEVERLPGEMDPLLLRSMLPAEVLRAPDLRSPVVEMEKLLLRSMLPAEVLPELAPWLETAAASWCCVVGSKLGN